MMTSQEWSPDAPDDTPPGEGATADVPPERDTRKADVTEAGLPDERVADDEAGADRRYELHLFSDFDGTISTTDIGFDLFDRFGVQEPWHAELLAGRIATADYWRRMAANLRVPITPELLDDYLRSIPIDPGIYPLLELCRAESIRFTIVSDGFDLYIERYLALNGVEGLELYANHAELDAEGRMRMTFPYAAEGCDCVSAACKRNIVLRAASPDARIVYIGDGVSDFCPAEHADIIFAKKKLAAHCNAERLPHYPFKTLSEVERQLHLLLERRRIRPRHQAVLKRKGVWEEEN